MYQPTNTLNTPVPSRGRAPAVPISRTQGHPPMVSDHGRTPVTLPPNTAQRLTPSVQPPTTQTRTPVLLPTRPERTPVLQSTRPVLQSTRPVLQSTRPVLQSTRPERTPMLQSTRPERTPVLQSTRPERTLALQSTRPERTPMLQSTRPERTLALQSTRPERAPMLQSTRPERTLTLQSTRPERTLALQSTRPEQTLALQSTRPERTLALQSTRPERTLALQSTRPERTLALQPNTVRERPQAVAHAGIGSTTRQKRIPVIRADREEEELPWSEMYERISRKLQNADFGVYNTNFSQRWNTITNIGNPASLARAIENGQMIHTTKDQGLRYTYLFEILMTEGDREIIGETLKEIGFTNIEEDVDVHYNLLWYLNMAEDPWGTRLTYSERGFISGLTNEELVELLGFRYSGPRDRASLLFATVSGKSADGPDVENIPRYKEVKKYKPSTVWYLAYNAYKIIDDEQSTTSRHPPYFHVALNQPSTIESIIRLVNEDNVEILLDKYQVVIPEHLELDRKEDRVDFFVKEISKYGPVLDRPETQLPPPVLIDMKKQQIIDVLSRYTLKEIVDAYEPSEEWGDREELTQVVIKGPIKGSAWSWRNKWCTNDNTMNIVEYELHGDMDKNDPQNPTLSYGVYGNYRCYQMEELAASFREIDGIFRFMVPDYTPRDNWVDPATGEILGEQFPLNSIQQLRKLLSRPPKGFNVRPLAVKVEQGLRVARVASSAVAALKNGYEAMTRSQQNIIRIYLAWLFVFSMWIKHWKGPGHEWPRQDNNFLCEKEARNEHVFIQQSVRSVISDKYDSDPVLKVWVDGLPLVDYNFNTGEASIATGDISTVKRLLNLIQLGDFCMAHGADLILKSAYYLITNVLGLREKSQFNAFIDVMLPVLSDIERDVVRRHLGSIRDPAANKEVIQRVMYLNNRLMELSEPQPKQPPFDPTGLIFSGHTDHFRSVSFYDDYFDDDDSSDDDVDTLFGVVYSRGFLQSMLDRDI